MASDCFAEASAAGYLVRKSNVEVWQTDKWVAGMGIVDFTNPNAREWFTGKLGALIDQGVDSFKTDFGERIPTDVVWHDGSDPARMHNYYSYLTTSSVCRCSCGPGRSLRLERTMIAPTTTSPTA